MEVLRMMLTTEVWGFLHDVLVGMENETSLSGAESLHRYSNNLITVSSVGIVELKPTEENENALYKRYICLP